MYLLRQAVAWLRENEFSALAEPILYRRSGEAPQAVDAIVGKTVFRQTDENGAFVRTQTRDFLVERETLDRDPSVGDTIEYDGVVYEAMAPGGEPAWSWSDPYRRVYRIHTKCISEE